MSAGAHCGSDPTAPISADCVSMFSKRLANSSGLHSCCCSDRVFMRCIRVLMPTSGSVGDGGVEADFQTGTRIKQYFIYDYKIKYTYILWNVGSYWRYLKDSYKLCHSPSTVSTMGMSLGLVLLLLFVLVVTVLSLTNW